MKQEESLILVDCRAMPLVQRRYAFSRKLEQASVIR